MNTGREGGRKVRRNDGWMYGGMNGWMEGWRDGGMNRWIEVWMDGYCNSISLRFYYYFYVYFSLIGN